MIHLLFFALGGAFVLFVEHVVLPRGKQEAAKIEGDVKADVAEAEAEAQRVYNKAKSEAEKL